jgi:hypothetical protein
MKEFRIKICFKFVLPLSCAFVLVIFWDPFKVLLEYDDYYNNNPITGNREDICNKLLLKSSENISNFIIGSSRSQAYKTAVWCTKIQEPMNKTFHYDGSGFGLYRSTNAIKFLAENYKINNVLLIVDTDFFSETVNNPGHLFIQPPHVSNESRFLYYFTFIKASLDIKFIFYNIVYKLTGKYYDFMGNHLNNSKNAHISNNSTGDIWYGYDQEIKSDSLSYYNNLIAKGVFYHRNKIGPSKPLICESQMKLLNAINQVVKKHKINLKIVVSPLYNQIKFHDSDMTILKKLFGNNNVYDFSGKNDFTEKITNYYENSHYKPNVANRIMDLIYSDLSK